MTTSPQLEVVDQVTPAQNVISPEALHGTGDPVNDREDHYEKTPADRKEGGAGLLWGLATLVFLALLAGGFFLFKGAKVEPVESSTETPMDRPASGRVDEKALDVLNRFLSASSLEEKAKYVIGKEETIPDMREFYGGGDLAESELKADFFSEWAMESSDTDRGIYLLEFNQPKQFKLRSLFVPITDLMTHFTFKEPDAQLRSKALRANFEMEAVRVHAYLKRIDHELLIDWHTYVQTKNRTFRDFIDYPVAGRKGTFRIGMSEEASSLYEEEGIRNYRITDPAYAGEDIAVVSVRRDSRIGKILEELAWTDILGKGPARKGATLVLQWSEEANPTLQISNIICWEFLGVGGDPSNLVSN